VSVSGFLRKQQLFHHLQLPHLAHLEEARVALRVHYVRQDLEVDQRLPAVLEAHQQLGRAGALAAWLFAGGIKAVDLADLRIKKFKEVE